MSEKIAPPPAGSIPHLEVVAAVIMRDDTILCAQRKAGGELSLKWEFPGGKVEPGESHRQALEREIDEELGMGIQAGEHIITVEHCYSAFSISLHAYRATVRSGVPECTEHLAVRWLRVDELHTLDWAPADVAVVERLAARVDESSAIVASALQNFARAWDTPWLFAYVKTAFSPRLTKSMGRCKPSTGEIRLNLVLLDQSDTDLLAYVVCHEAAHVVNFVQHGRSVRPHGPEWRSLVSIAGFLPSCKLKRANKNVSMTIFPKLKIYEHRCPVCQAIRYSSSPIRRWRCSACMATGLPGDLVIIKHTKNTED